MFIENFVHRREVDHRSASLIMPCGNPRSFVFPWLVGHLIAWGRALIADLRTLVVLASTVWALRMSSRLILLDCVQ
jgi:hypothetical protein